MNINRTSIENSCESYEIDISAMLDGELDGPQKAALGQHLIQCESCRQLARDFEAINQLASVDANHTQHTSLTPAIHTRSQRHSRLAFFGAVAASVLAASVILVIWLNSNTPQQVTAGELVQPISELQEISFQRQRNQEQQLKTMELQLRQLRLEVAGLKDDQAQSDMQTKLDSMLNRVFKQQFYAAFD